MFCLVLGKIPEHYIVYDFAFSIMLQFGDQDTRQGCLPLSILPYKRNFTAAFNKQIHIL